MRIAATFFCLLLVISCSSSSSDNENVVADLQTKVDELSTSLTAANESEAALEAKVEALQTKLDAASEEMKSGAYAATWPDDYRTMWTDICALVLKDQAEADPAAAPSQDICECSLNGLMKAFTVRQYESWSQEIKDAAVAPYLTLCWSS
jgi:outer membrane murein-binding lipoprotein Lpp